MKKGITFAGNLIVDQIKFIEAYPAPSSLTNVLSVAKSLGGLVCNCAVDMAKIAPEIPLKVMGVIGEDDMGDYVLDQLHMNPSIDTSFLLRKGITSFTDVMTQSSDGTRTFFTYGGANDLLTAQDFDFSKLDADILHIGYILLLKQLDGPDPEYPTAMCRVLDMAKQHGIKTSIDVVSEEGSRFPLLVPPALKYTDYCIINELEAEKTTGIPLKKDDKLLLYNFQPCLEALAEMGVGRWVVIHTPELSYGLDIISGKFVKQESWYIPPGFKVSSVGAGDAFACGILHGAYNDKSLDEAINAAGAVAAYSLSGSGSSDALVPLDVIIKNMKALSK